MTAGPYITELDEARDDVLVDHIVTAWVAAEGAYWRRRAEQFEAARPRVGDFLGRAGRAGRREAWQRLTDTANACRARASLGDLADTTAHAALVDAGGLTAAATASRRPGAAA